MGSSEERENNKKTEIIPSSEKKGSLQKSYFDVLGLCCSSEVPLIERILRPLEGVVEVSVIVPSRTVIVLHDTLLISQLQIVKALNQARLEANVRVIGKANYRGKWPSPYVLLSGLFLALSFLKYIYHPLQWLAVAAVAVGIWPILMRGVVAVRNFTLDVNILMLIAVVGTIVMKDYVEAGTIVFLFTIAEWLESRASHKATAVMSSLMSMTPQKATIAETGEVVNVEDVKLNTILAVKVGEIVPVDGVVVEGACEIDEKTLTGESFPVAKQKDSIVWAGTVNVNGYISVKATALAQDCAVAKMARLVEEAQNNKSSVQRLIDRCAKYYTPAVVLVSAVLALIPVILKLHNLRNWFHLALVVLVSACPCGLILSTPVATFCALSRAATAGLLIKGGDYLEILAKVRFIAFDKTGTLTRGEFTMMNFESLADDVSFSTLLYWVSSIESKSSHPIAGVLVDYARSHPTEPKPENVEDFQNFPGEGVSGKIDGREIYIGNKKLAQRANCMAASTIGGDAKDGRTSGYIYSDGTVIGAFSLSDNCRSGARDAIRELKSMGIKTALLSGDSQSAAMHAQEQLGHALEEVHAELLPEDKARIIQDYKREGMTAMVGDGVNDAPALATADVGISMGVSGSALATETGHVILMSNDIRKIPKAIKLARRTRHKVIQNIIFSVATKAGVLGFAFAGHPLVWLAVLVDVATCLIVIFNSMLLLRGSHGHGHKFLGLFSCHSHKGKCQSTSQHCSGKSNEQCCSKKAAPKMCESTVCGSQKTQCCSTTISAKPLECSLQKTCSSHDPNSEALKSSHCSSCPSECQSDPHDHHSSPCEGNLCNLPDDSCCEEVKEEEILECTHAHHKDSEGPSQSEHRLVISDRNHHEKKTCHEHEIREDIISSCEDRPHRSHPHHHHHHDHHHEHKSCEEKVGQQSTSIICEDHCHGSDRENDHHHHHHRHHHDHDHEDNHGHDHDHNHTHNHNHPHQHRSHHHHHHHHHDVIMSHGSSCHVEDVVKHVCPGLRKREVGACCKSFRRECCGTSRGHFMAGPRLTEIITE